MYVKLQNVWVSSLVSADLPKRKRPPCFFNLGENFSAKLFSFFQSFSRVQACRNYNKM